MKGSGVSGIFGNLHEAVDQNGVEQFGGALHLVENTPFGPHFLRRQWCRARTGPVDGVDGVTEVPHHVPFASPHLAAPIAALLAAQGELIRHLLRCGSCSGPPRSKFRRHGGQVGQVSGAIPVLATEAVLLVEVDGELQGLKTLHARGRSMLAADFHQSHGEVERRPNGTVTVNQFDAGVPAVAARELDGLRVCLAPCDGLVEFIHLHIPSTPDTWHEQCASKARRPLVTARPTRPHRPCRLASSAYTHREISP